MDDAICLADVINRFRMFVEKVSPQMVFDLFNETLAEPLTANNLKGIAFLFDCLSTNGLIGYCWQTALANDGVILLRDRSRSQSFTAFSSAVYRAKLKRPIYDNDIEFNVRKIKLRHL